MKHLAENEGSTDSSLAKPGSNAVVRVCTAAVAPAQHADFWGDLVCDVFVQLDCSRINRSFRGTFRTSHLDAVQIYETDPEAQQASRGPRL